MELPVAGTVSSDDFETGTAAALAGGTTTIIDFVHPGARRRLARRAGGAQGGGGQGGRRLRPAHGRHLVGRGPARRRCRSCLDDEGVPTVQGLPGLQGHRRHRRRRPGRGDDRQRPRIATRWCWSMPSTARSIEHLRDRFAAAGKTAPRYPRAVAPARARGRGDLARRRLWPAAVGARSTSCTSPAPSRSRRSPQAHASAAGPVTGETCPQYLLLDDSVYDRPDFEGAAYVVAPPIRPAGHQEALWQALESRHSRGRRHRPLPVQHGRRRTSASDDFRLIPGGAAGIEHRLSLLYTHGVLAGRLDLHRFVDLVSTRPGKTLRPLSAQGLDLESAPMPTW